MRRPALLLVFLGWLVPAHCATRILVTVVEQRSARPVTDLQADEFLVRDSGRPRAVEAAVFSSDSVDAMLLVDTSLMGNAVQPVAADLIGQLQEKEQMALVAYHSSADLVQDFTSSKNSLLRALSEVRYGNQPRVLDAIYAAADAGFENSILRRVVLLITEGTQGPSQVLERDVVRLARRKGVSIFTIYLSPLNRSLFSNLAGQTGGVAMSITQLGKELEGQQMKPAERVFEAVRGHYILTLQGNLAVGEKLQVEVTRKSKAKLAISALPLD